MKIYVDEKCFDAEKYEYVMDCFKKDELYCDLSDSAKKMVVAIVNQMYCKIYDNIGVIDLRQLNLWLIGECFADLEYHEFQCAIFEILNSKMVEDNELILYKLFNENAKAHTDDDFDSNITDPDIKKIVEKHCKEFASL